MLIGTDTELFLRKEDKFLSAYNVIPGSKSNPYPVKKGMVSVDGMALEFGIDPAHSFPVFKSNINTVLSRLQDLIPEDHEMAVVASVLFDEEYMEAQPEESKILGCDPDYNAWTGEENPQPEAHPTMRTAGGHLHIGFIEGALKKEGDQAHFEDCRTIVKELDYYNGLFACVVDNDNRRMNMYGQAGAFRPKPYGVEYRTLSNFWILRDDYMERVFNGCNWAIEGLKENKSVHEKFKDAFDVRSIINNNDKFSASNLLTELGAHL